VKTIPLKTLPGEFPIEYRQVLEDVLRRPSDPQQGIGIDEMRKSIRVMDALDAANGELQLEDADYDHLKTKLLAMRWNTADRRILQLVEDVTG
jgi:hypothetical protein